MNRKIVFLLVATVLVLAACRDAGAKEGFYAGLGTAYNTINGDFKGDGGLQGGSVLRYLSHSAAAGQVVAIPDNSYSSTAVNDTQLQWYNYDYLTFASSVTLPNFLVGTNHYAGHGRFVFYNSAGSKVFVLLQADPTASLLYDYGITTY